MAATESTTVILPLNLGAASKYEQAVFPLSYYDAGNTITKGSLLLSATLDEMIKIAEMGIDLNTDEHFQFNARVQYEALAAKEAKLQSRSKSFNPFTRFRHYRAAKMFLTASKSLFLETKRTSERIQREEKLMRAVPSKDLHDMNDTVPQGATIQGIAVTLPGALDDDAQQKILAATNAIALRANLNVSDPFVDNPNIPQWSDDDSIITLADTASLLSQDEPSSDPQEAEPQSSRSSYNNYFFHSILIGGSSNVNGMVLNHSSGNIGGSTTTPP